MTNIPLSRRAAKKEGEGRCGGDGCAGQSVWRTQETHSGLDEHWTWTRRNRSWLRDAWMRGCWKLRYQCTEIEWRTSCKDVLILCMYREEYLSIMGKKYVDFLKIACHHKCRRKLRMFSFQNLMKSKVENVRDGELEEETPSYWHGTNLAPSHLMIERVNIV